MNVREKLIEILEEPCDSFYHACELADYLIANGVTVQKHAYLETAVEVKDNTVCGNGVKIEYKRCSYCKSPAKFFEDDFCWNCGAKLDLLQSPKGE